MSERFFFILLLVIGSLGPFAADSYLASMPAMGDAFQASENQMQLTLSIYFLGYALPQIFYGPLSDKIGRRKTILTGFCISLFGSFMVAFAPTIHWLLAGRLIQGLGVAGQGALFRTILRDRYQGTELARVGAIVGMFFSFLPAIAPVIGGLVQQYLGWEANMYLFVLLNTAVIGITYKYFPETAPSLNHRALHLDQFIKNYTLLLSSPAFIGYALASGSAFSGIIAYFTISPYLLQEHLGLTPLQYGLSSVTIALGLLCGHFVNSRLVVKLGVRTMIQWGFRLMLGGGTLLMLLLFFFPLSIIILLPTVFLYIIGAAIVFGNSTAGAFQPFSKIAGAAGAMFGTLQILFTAAVSALVAMETSPNQEWLIAITFFMLGLFAYTSYFFLIRKKEIAHSPH